MGMLYGLGLYINFVRDKPPTGLAANRYVAAGFNQDWWQMLFVSFYPANSG